MQNEKLELAEKINMAFSLADMERPINLKLLASIPRHLLRQMYKEIRFFGLTLINSRGSLGFKIDVAKEEASKLWAGIVESHISVIVIGYYQKTPIVVIETLR